MIGVHDLPAVNATLNATSAVLLTTGYTLIRRKKIRQHKRVMIAAFCVSVVFLVCYLIYHSQVGSVSSFIEKVPAAQTKPFQTPLKQPDAAFGLVREIISHPPRA